MHGEWGVKCVECIWGGHKKGRGRKKVKGGGIKCIKCSYGWEEGLAVVADDGLCGGWHCMCS